MAKIENITDPAIKPLQKILMSMCAKTGYTPDSVFEGLLDYIIGFLNPSLKPQPIDGWKFKNEDTPFFFEMLQAVIECYRTEIPRKGWYDPFGDLYMALHSGGGGKGQFFTPSPVANLTAKVTVGGWQESEGTKTPFGKRITISDSAAGSGRMPLAGYCELLKIMQTDWGYSPQKAEANRPYVCCEDLDFNCVKMSAINLAFHGCFGEAVCHDTLTEPDTVRLGYIINETMWPFPSGIPSIRKESEPLRFVATRLWILRDKAKEQTEREIVEQKKHTEKKTEPVQLSLF